jgi:hypothetical protein
MFRKVLSMGVATAALATTWWASPSFAQAEPDQATFIVEYAAGLGGHVVWGDQDIVDGSRIATWAVVSNADDSILAVGATLGMKIIETMPEEGEHPAGAFSALQFPEIVRETTYLQHLEIHPEPHGHITSPLAVNPNRNSVPHFDFHFYSVPEADLYSIPAASPPLPPVPAALLPVGYSQPGGSIAQMGRHSSPWVALNDPGFLRADMIAGFLVNGSRMHFIEPMISQEKLLEKVDFELPTPRPQTFGRSMLYPTNFKAKFHGRSCSLVLTDFVGVE